ncbi:MAG: lipase maturation factor family protein [Candidatus Obscuribacterales bacterium]|nr:lipase maturation factor family protein [Candidatus Obscuribacterales bacterium]
MKSKVHSHLLIRWIFLRMVSLCFLAAFLSMLVQIIGLYGKNGIIPISQLLAWRSEFGWEILYRYPSVFWLNTSDSFLQLVCVAGAAASALALFGVITGPMILLAWFLYLSICSVGQDFMSFQWDSLLLETALLAAFYAPWKMQEPTPMSAEFKKQPEGSLIFLWLIRLLLFKLMFLSGIVKIASGDPAWRDLTALDYHYETQPLPVPLAWFVAKLPEVIQKLSTFMMFAIELGFPFLIFGIRPLRMLAGFGLVFLQLLIISTGNYAFFNWLTIALSISALDDQMIIGLLPRSLQMSLQMHASTLREKLSETRKFIIPGALIATISLGFFANTFFSSAVVPAPVKWLIGLADPLRSFNTYGLFAIMTTKRPEIVIEGSNDGQTWIEYEFKYKPGNIKRMPPSVAPHQPRMDWQMWFAALAPDRVAPWFSLLVERLLQGNQEVLALFDHNPFPDGPPKMIRAVLYDYHFSNAEGLFQRGEWWSRKPVGTYMEARSKASM